MTELIISLLLAILTIAFVMIFLYKREEFSFFHVSLYFVLLISWTTMMMFKTNPNLQSKGFISTHWWTWPLMISLYQFIQVIVRLPIGILSQKLRSRKEPIMLIMLVLLIGLTLVISSNFADWSIIIAIITSGAMGATFGIDSQYWSENWNIKKGFYSSMIIFTIPFIAKMIANSFNVFFQNFGINLFWVSFIAILALTITFIFYAIIVKENKKTIFIDNMNPNAKPFKNKSIYDVMIISFSTALISASFSFVTFISYTMGNITNTQKLIFPLVQIAFVIFTPLVFLKFIKIWYLSIISSVILFFSSIILSILLISNNIDTKILIVFIVLANASFGIYFGIMFSSTLHFDHKYPALVLGIFLTIKSFFTGSSELTSNLLVSKQLGLSVSIIGFIALGLTIGLTAISLSLSSHNLLFKGKQNTNKGLMEDAYQYEIKN